MRLQEEIASKKDQLDLSSKVVKNINDNQGLLLSSIEKHVDKNSTIILDGHFCLLNSEKQITPIPLETFTCLSPAALVVIHREFNS